MIRGAAAARRRRTRKVTLVALVAGFVVGAGVALLTGAAAGGAIACGVLVGLVAAVVGWAVVALRSASPYGPPGQH